MWCAALWVTAVVVQAAPAVKPGTRPVLAGVETGPSGALIGNLEEALAAYRAQAIPADVVEGDDV